MDTIYSLNKPNQAAMLEGLALLSQIYWGPGADSGRHLLEGMYFKPFEALMPVVRYDPSDIIDELKTIHTSFANEVEIFQYLEQAYVRSFINSRDGITAPLYASCYPSGEASVGDSRLMGPSAVLIKERFESKGLSLANHIHEPPDHLSIELEYLYFLLEKGWSVNDTTLMDEAVSFTAENMLPWVLRFQQRLVAIETECRFYHLTTTILCAILRFVGGSPSQQKILAKSTRF